MLLLKYVLRAEAQSPECGQATEANTNQIAKSGKRISQRIKYWNSRSKATLLEMVNHDKIYKTYKRYVPRQVLYLTSRPLIAQLAARTQHEKMKRKGTEN